MESHRIYNIMIVVVLVGLSALFTTFEMVLKSENQRQIQQQLEEERNTILATLLFGNYLLKIASVVFATLLFLELSPTYAVFFFDTNYDRFTLVIWRNLT